MQRIGVIATGHSLDFHLIEKLMNQVRQRAIVRTPDRLQTNLRAGPLDHHMQQLHIVQADLEDSQWLSSAILDSRTDNQSYIVAAHQPITYRAVVETAGRLLNRPALILPIPSKLLRLIASFLSFTPWANRLRPDQVDRLTEDKKFDVSPIEKILNRPLRTFSEGLNEILKRGNGPQIE